MLMGKFALAELGCMLNLLLGVRIPAKILYDIFFPDQAYSFSEIYVTKQKVAFYF